MPSQDLWVGGIRAVQNRCQTKYNRMRIDSRRKGNEWKKENAKDLNKE